MKIRSVGKVKVKGKSYKHPFYDESYFNYRTRISKDFVIGRQPITDEMIEDAAMEVYGEGKLVNNISIFHKLKEAGYVNQRSFDDYINSRFFTKRLTKKGWKTQSLKGKRSKELKERGLNEN
jgi:hypothetical protein